MVDFLINSYESSDEYHEVQNQVAEICQQGGEMLEKRSHANFFTQSLVLTRRSSLNMFRDLGYYWMRFVSYVILALGLGTIYYNVDLSYRSIEERGLMVAFVVSFMTFMTVGGFPSFVEDMKVYIFINFIITTN